MCEKAPSITLRGLKKGETKKNPSFNEKSFDRSL